MVFVTIAGLVVAILGLPAVWIAVRANRTAVSAAEFSKVRQYVKSHQPELYSLAWAGSSPASQNADIPLLVKEGWLMKTPRPLDCISLKLVEQDVTPLGAQPRTRLGVPLRARHLCYSEALARSPGGEGLFNGALYRPLQVEGTRGGLRITCTPGRYFDYLDNGEVLAHEAGARLAKGKDPLAGPRRKAITDPFELSSRPTSLGVNTLTIRKGDTGESGFYMHKRSGSHVVNEEDQVGVVPAGEFTPSDISHEAMQADFSIWRNIMREYAEEFLNMPESYGRGGRTLDYEHDAPFAELSAARSRGDLDVWTFGVAVDPLCFKPELLTVCIFSANAFDAIFADLTPSNDEGTLLVGRNRHGIPFNSHNVKLYADSKGTSLAAAASLKLAWRHRRRFGLA